MKSYRVLVAATMMTVSAAPWIYAQEDDTPALKAAPLVSSSTVSPPARAATATSAATAIPARQMLNAQEAMRYEALSVRAKRSAQEETELRNLEKTGNDRVAEYLALSEKTTRTAAEDERLDTLRDTMLRNANQQVSREAAAYGLASGSQQPIKQQPTKQPGQLRSVRSLSPSEEAGLLIRSFRDSLRRSGDAVQMSQAADVTQVHLSSLLIQQNDQIIQQNEQMIALMKQLAAQK
jgi:hypothetical protein